MSDQQGGGAGRGSPVPDGGWDVHQQATAADEAAIYQAGRDLRVEEHHHYEDGSRRARRTPSASAGEECPYPGLAAFGRAQSRWFQGRDRLVSELLAGLDSRLRDGGVQAVIAPSGAGKSSLLHAGVLPRLEAGALPGSRHWPQVVLTPTAHPLAVFATRIAAMVDVDPARLKSDLKTDAQAAVTTLRRMLRSGDETRAVLVVDQFEELFTLCEDESERRTFVEVLARIAQPTDAPPPGLVVIGLRADFYAACTGYPALRHALGDRPLVIGPMSDDELRETILHPAHDVGLDVEPGLVELLLRELGDTATSDATGTAHYQAGRLPLLAHVLRGTWQRDFTPDIGHGVMRRGSA